MNRLARRGLASLPASLLLLAACSAGSPSASESEQSATTAAATPSPTASATAEPRYTLSGRMVLCPQGTGGEDIVVRDGAGTIIGLGEVGDRIGDSLAWEFEVEDLPASDFYVVEVGDGLVEGTFTLDELTQEDWYTYLVCPE